MASYKIISLLIVGFAFAANLHLSEAQIGVCYGTKGDNLPAPKDVVDMFATVGISKVRLVEPNKDTLTALKGKNVEVVLGFPNELIIPASLNPAMAVQWVEANVKPYVPAVKIKYLVVGTELSRNSDLNAFTFFSTQAMQNIHAALQKLGLKDIKVTISCDSSIIAREGGNPLPSTSSLIVDSGVFLKEFLKFLNDTGAPFMVNMWPYYELILHPKDITPEFVLFTANGTVLTDGKLSYQNKFDAMLDSFYTILEKQGFPNMEVIVAETGWPSSGGVHATEANEKTYITNLVKHVNKGTPKRPNKPVQVYLNLIDENQRGRPEVEKHFGVFTADNRLKFAVDFAHTA